MNNVNTGKIVQISGPVIDVQFESGVLPKIREALSLTVDGRRYVMEVAQHVGDNTVRCVMLSGSEGLSRGMQVEAPGKTIEVAGWAKHARPHVQRARRSHRRRRSRSRNRAAQKHLQKSSVV